MTYETIKISKLDAASRQLDCALDLWFHDKDEVSIHTLASAAYQIVHDINEASGSPRDLLYNKSWLKDENLRKVVGKLKMPANFFKHADRDPDPTGNIDFIPALSRWLMALVQLELRRLGQKSTDIQRAFIIWLAIREPQIVSEQSFPANHFSSMSVEVLGDIRALSKKDMLRACQQGFADNRRKRNRRSPSQLPVGG